uniref:EF-hand domain-containing protein n=1 Tax=Macrostomum lignano TaxID=282301 RepID=A0A1I8FJA0_9PLAT
YGDDLRRRCGVGKSATRLVARKKKQQQQQQQQKTRQNSSKSAFGMEETDASQGDSSKYSNQVARRGDKQLATAQRVSAFSFIMEGERQKAKGESAPTDRRAKRRFRFLRHRQRRSDLVRRAGTRCCASSATKVNEEEVKTMIADVGTQTETATVEFNEFLRMMRSYYHRHCDGHSEDAEMWEAFKAFDHNGDNYIDFTEIKKTMPVPGRRASQTRT